MTIKYKTTFITEMAQINTALMERGQTSPTLCDKLVKYGKAVIREKKNKKKHYSDTEIRLQHT